MKNKANFLIGEVLKEDIERKDLTTELLIPQDLRIKANIIAKENGVIAGLKVAEEVFRIQDSENRKQKTEDRRRGRIKFRTKIRDGKRVKKGQVIAEIYGWARTILTAERVALNFLQHLSGIATLTRRYVDAIQAVKRHEGRGTRIYDTRKTTPLWRELEKYAVRCGGGYNHRMGLYDQVLIKENHLKIIKNAKFPPEADQPMAEKIKNLRKKVPKKIKVEMETQNLEQVKQALEAGVDIIMLDNMSFSQMKRAIQIIRKTPACHPSGRKNGKPEIEVSGGVNLKNVKRITQLGVDRISVGEITHSAPALDISLEVANIYK